MVGPRELNGSTVVAAQQTAPAVNTAGEDPGSVTLPAATGYWMPSEGLTNRSILGVVDPWKRFTARKKLAVAPVFVWHATSVGSCDPV